MSAALSSWLDGFPELGALEPEAAKILTRDVRAAHLPQGVVLFREGDPCRDFMLVTCGQVRVQKIAESGREIVLYRVEKGQSCILTTTCLVSAETYTAEGIAETEVDAVVIPGAAFHALLGLSSVFRGFVFAAYAQRLSGLMALIEEVAFRRIDLRLARSLLERCGEDGAVRFTHQELAVELGTAREVVSRQLKEFERRGWLDLKRGAIHLLAPAALLQLAETV